MYQVKWLRGAIHSQCDAVKLSGQLQAFLVRWRWSYNPCSWTGDSTKLDHTRSTDNDAKLCVYSTLICATLDLRPYLYCCYRTHLVHKKNIINTTKVVASAVKDHWRPFFCHDSTRVDWVLEPKGGRENTDTPNQPPTAAGVLRAVGLQQQWREWVEWKGWFTKPRSFQSTNGLRGG